MIRSKLLTTTNREAVSVERERLNSLVNSMADGVIAIDERNTVVIYNGAALNILDINSTMTGQALPTIMNLVDPNNQSVDIVELVRSTVTATTSRDYSLRYPDDSRINLYLSIAPVHLGYGKGGQKGHVLLLRDITHEKALEEERNDFISVVSHELRTPIAIAEGSIGNAIFIMEKTNDKDKTKEALNKAHEQVVFLSDMVNDLSTLSRAEGNKLKLEVEPINVAELVNDLVTGYRSQAEAKGLQLLSELDPTLELLNSGKLYVREVLQNFVTNSIKYTEHGSVTLGARPKDKGVEFYVADTGIGISQADREKIFDKFFRSNDERARSSTGKGLGLYITMKLARLLHAEISVDSELNKGSRFSIFIPNLG
ncbi:MAG: PAS domain-containing sensor histidine kinase [Candidatus Saccharibacteria bacterium]|nr:PAS domain-containing sensor histidine kinase [Candidatus Saccharibacteria bacterium]